jgi:hypothetical protein
MCETLFRKIAAHIIYTFTTGGGGVSVTGRADALPIHSMKN